MAECHPVGFQWVMEARERGAEIFHVDPRFTRTSAAVGEHLPIRVGTDIAFLGGLINHVLEGEHWFREYVLNYTNAATILREDYCDTEELDGVFSGWDEASGTYKDPSSWGYEGTSPQAAAGQRGEQSHGAHGADIETTDPPETDRTLQDPRCVMQVLRRHFARYTPEMVERTCGIPQEQFRRIADAIVRNSGRERTTAFIYSVGWTHHTTGVQIIRAASILQLLLGNVGRPGGGIMALRGHASIQGSTDIPTLYNILPGYLPMPQSGRHDSLEDYCTDNTPQGGFWGHTRAYMTSLLKAWWGDAATADNDFAYGYLPRLTGDHSSYPTMAAMREGEVEGYFLMGENPTVGSANGKLHRLAMAELKWLVVRDLQQIESATFWKDGPEIETGELRTEDIGTEVFFLPAATHAEKAGSFTNTHRLLQWRRQAVEPPADCRSELHFMYHLIRRVREKLAGSPEPRDRAILELTWDYETHGAQQEPDAEEVLREISGYRVDGDAPLGGYLELAEDGSTACGCWIYSGCYADGVNQTARRPAPADHGPSDHNWGWAWPLNRRVLYNRASADPAGRPWSARKRLVEWDAGQGKWVGDDIPDFKADMAPDYVPDEEARAELALRGDSPFVMQADGRGWLYAPAGVLDGPLPVHYEPFESVVGNPVHPSRRESPSRQTLDHPDNPYNPPGSDVFPYALMTYRIAEHHTAGGMSRFLPYLSELAPDPFVEVSPELAAERGLEHGEWVTIVTARTAVEARALVTDRMRPQQINGTTVHTVGAPYHWGPNGLATGDAANDLMPIAMDRNVHISEFKAATCDIRPGRRPRGPELVAFVEDYRRRAGVVR
jgi:formate dehydrogenase major subunit